MFDFRQAIGHDDNDSNHDHSHLRQTLSLSSARPHAEHCRLSPFVPLFLSNRCICSKLIRSEEEQEQGMRTMAYIQPHRRLLPNPLLLLPSPS